MSYRPEREDIRGPIETLLEGLSESNIKDLQDAALAREESGDYKEPYMDNLFKALEEIRSVKRSLRKLL